jgi:phospholipase C
MADKKNEDSVVARRSFLKALGLSAGAAATTVAGMAPTVAVAAESDAEKLKARYKETDHVKAFYRTNRY